MKEVEVKERKWEREQNNCKNKIWAMAIEEQVAESIIVENKEQLAKKEQTQWL